jgi:DNA-binding NarL/FixJ family response regulator
MLLHAFAAHCQRMSVKVVIADDHPPTRAGIRSVLEGRGFEICAEVGTGPTAVEAAQQYRPDLCILDINMPGDGITAAAEISQTLPETEIVMLTVSQDDESLLAALQAGAAGYLLKDTDPERLASILRGILAGDTILPRPLVTRAVAEFRVREQRRRLRHRGAERLTSREWDVLEGLGEGLSTKAIAERLDVAQVTVRSHVAAILRKLEVADRNGAVRLLHRG